MLTHPFIGAGYYLRGLRLIVQPGLRRYVITPLAVNTIVFIGLIAVLTERFKIMLHGLMERIPDWLAWLQWLLWPLFALGMLIVVFYTFSILANLIAAPFNGLLAEAVERRLGGEPPPQGGGWLTALKSAPHAIVEELRKLSYFAKWALPLLVLFFIPVLNVAAPLLWLAFSSWMMAIEYCGYGMDNHNLPAEQQRGRLAGRRLMSLSFGAVVLGATLIPLLNLVVMPAAVAGGTALWLERLQAEENRGG